ncbi:MAG: cupredoxin family copper-binding protein [Candidatus Pacebacteria bacterium]|nr:cupredoxin family copper-binding protein [Candidatus Paceibacterota bacterium]
MKKKALDILFIGANLLIVILLFTIVDHAIHGLEGAWSVPDYYFKDKIPFGFFWAIVGYFLVRKYENIWLKAFLTSGLIAIILQTRYFWEGYPLGFVLIFLFFHFVILFVVSVIMYALLGRVYKNNQTISMKTFIIVIIVLAVIAIGAYYLVFNNQNTGTNTYAPTPTESMVSEATPTMSEIPAPSSVSVNIANFAYSPATITVKAGTKVTWTNSDSAPHTITSDSGSVLNSPRLAQGDLWSFTFTTPGTYAYHCAVHPMMKATVVVTQ